jgi:diguanylate cyclase (GGDEF)-like protein/PAS domain S-box-containing protein
VGGLCLLATLGGGQLAHDHATQEAAALQEARLARGRTVVGLQVQRTTVRLDGLARGVAGHRGAELDRRWPGLTAWVAVDVDLPGAALVERVGRRYVVTRRRVRPGQPGPPVGLDLGRSGLDRVALEPARRTQALRATPPVGLLPDGRPGSVVVLPVPGPGRPRWITSALAVSTVRTALTGALGSQTGLALDDGDRPLVRVGDVGPDGASTAVGVGGRTWTLTVARPAPDLTATVAILVLELLLSAGIALAVLGAGRRADARADRAGRELEAYQERFRAAFEGSAVGWVLGDADGRLLEVNAAALRLLGLDGDAVPGIGFQRLVHPDDVRTCIGRQRAALAGATELPPVELRFVRPDGTVVWALVTTALIRHDDGAPRLFSTQLIDVTERRRIAAALEDSEARYRTTADLVPVGVFEADRRGALTYANAEWRRLTGGDPARADGLGWWSAVHEDDVDEVMDRWSAAAAEGQELVCDLRLRTPTGDLAEVQLRATPRLDATGEVRGFLGSCTDLTQRHAEAAARAALEREQRRAQQRFRVAFDEAPIGMAIVGLDGRFVEANAALSSITGYDAEALVDLAPFAFVHPDDLDTVQASFAGLTPERPELAIEHRILHAAGHTVWTQARVSLVGDEDGAPRYAIAQVLDVTERRRYEDRLEHLADHDPLTGLLNRRGFDRALTTQVARGRREGPDGALLVLDLDGFKYVNDTLGHAVGDDLIAAVADALRGRLRESDVLARLGGDELAVLLPTGGAQEARTVGEDVLRSVRAATAGLGPARQGCITASIGVTVLEPGASAEDLLVNADLAMYDAKAAGGDRVAVYCGDDPQCEPRIRSDMRWVDRVRHALREDRFVLHVQPVVDLATHEVVLHEALVRMLDEEGRVIPPASFLFVAERFGLAAELDAWVLDAAIGAMGRARREGWRLPLAVNVSGASAGEPELPAHLAACLERHRVEGSDLVVEITETAAVADLPAARRFAEAVRALGCAFAIDDFGAGFGSFGYLKHLPFDLLKVDGDFVRSASRSAVDQLIIRAVVDIARGMGCRTVAEFVPDEQHVRLLLRAGIDLGQGFHLGRPEPLDALLARRGVPSPTAG